jgi:hypothetical protein
MRAIFVLAAGLGLIAGAAAPIAAQVETPADPPGVIEDCRIVPGEDGAPPPSGDTLSEALAPCDGVLAPPPVGDPDIAIPPPQGGATPVIDPDDVPEQPADGG